MELADADREGRQYLAAGSARIVPVILTSDMIVGEFTAPSDKIPQRLSPLAISPALTSQKFSSRRINTRNRFDDGKKFQRGRCRIARRGKAPAFITACVARDKDGIPKSAIKIMWDEAKVTILTIS